MTILTIRYHNIPYHTVSWPYYTICTVSYRTLAYLRLNSEGGYFMAISDWAEELAVLAPVRGIAADTELDSEGYHKYSANINRSKLPNP